MTILERFRVWNSRRQRRALLPADEKTAAKPPKTTLRLRRAWLPSWIRGDYTLANSELIFAAVSRISNSLSAMPVRLYKGPVRASNALADLVEFCPNPNMTACQFFRTMEACRCTSGNAYALKICDGQGRVTRLDILNPDRVRPVLDTDSGELWYRISPDPERGQDRDWYVHNYYVLHTQFVSTGGYTGVSPISVLTDTLNYAAEIQKFNAGLLEQGVNAQIVLSAPANLGKEQRERMISDFMDTYRETSGNILLLESGVTAESLKLSPIDTKILEVEKITRSKVAMVYNLPPHLLGDYSNESYSSQEQQMLEFLSLTMLPIVTMYEAELNRALLTMRQRTAGYHFKFDLTSILRADASTQAEVDYKAVRSGWKTIDEIRAERNYPPLPGGIGNKAMISQDLATVEFTVRDKPRLAMEKRDPPALPEPSGTGS